MSEMPEHFQQRGPNHFRDDAPYQVCDLCGRKSWASERSGPCGMPQPDGSRCAGTFREQAAARTCPVCRNNPVTTEIEGRVLVCTECANDPEIREHARTDWR